MSYATLDQLTDRFGERMLIRLTDRGEVATETIDTDVIDRALADADAVINGYLGRYALPLAATPPLIADLAQAIAIWKLHVYEPDPKIKADYDQALKSLAQISSGVIQLDLDGAEPEGAGGTGVEITDRDRPLTEATMKGFI